MRWRQHFEWRPSTLKWRGGGATSSTASQRAGALGERSAEQWKSNRELVTGASGDAEVCDGDEVVLIKLMRVRCWFGLFKIEL